MRLRTMLPVRVAAKRDVDEMRWVAVQRARALQPRRCVEWWRRHSKSRGALRQGMTIA